jgi:putative aminopeptidase FrvX
MPTPQLLHDLVTAVGPSGHETSPARIWREWCSRFCSDVHADKVGSSWARLAGSAGGPTLAVVGHIDEIGLHITYIDDEGYLRFDQVGGWDPIVLVGQRVMVITRTGSLTGVIARKPIHLLQDDERRKMLELKDLHIDIGARDGDEARERVRIGDVAVVDVQPVEMPNDRVVARALDNRVGCYVVARAAELVAEGGGTPGTFIAMAVAQEETTFAGARTSAFTHEPDVAIAVDVTFATDQPGIELGQIAKHPMGSGPVIARGTTLHPHVFELLYDTAREEQIPFTLESQGRSTGTDADAIHFSRSGVATGLVSVPLRYMHSPVEMVALDDAENAARLIASFARRLTAEFSFER